MDLTRLTFAPVSIRHYRNNTNDLKKYIAAWALYEDNYGILWIGTGRGFCRYDIKRNQFENHYQDPELADSNKGPFTLSGRYVKMTGVHVWLADIGLGVLCL